jgi:enoyl-CoA hydratase/carnithine racemase
MSEKLLHSQSGRVLTLTINKPEVRNAIDPSVMQTLLQALQSASQDPTVGVIVLTGAGGHFCSGADIKAAMSTATDQSLADSVYHTLTQVYAPVQMAIRNSPKPVIAAVEGYAAGFGFDLALRCDLRLASENAQFAELFIRVGLIPDGGGTYLLPRLIGVARAMEMMFTGRTIGADEAQQIGLVNQVWPAERFQAEVQAFAAQLAANAPLALERGKKAMLVALETSYEAALAQEALYQREIFNSEDGAEGFMAFLEKRPPVWKGR